MKGYYIGVDKAYENGIRILYQNDEIFHISLSLGYLTIQIIFCYISPSSQTEIMTIFDRVDPNIPYCIITGDLNARIGRHQKPHPNSCLIRHSKDVIINLRGRELIKCLEERDFFVLNGNCESDLEGEYTFCNKNGNSTIDLSLCSSDVLSKLDFKVLDEISTQHFPVLTTIEGPSRTINVNEYIKMTWDGKKTSSFRDSLDFILKFQISDNNIQLFTKAMMKAAADNNMHTRRELSQIQITHSTKWFDKSCLERKKATQALLRKFRNSSEPINKQVCKQNYLSAQRYYVHYIRAKKLKFYSSLDLKLTDSRNPRDFYSALSYYRPKYSNTSTKENVTPDNFKKYYANLFSNTNFTDNEIESITDNAELDSEFVFSELNEAISKLSKKKAAGPDSIINEMWINLSISQRLMLLDCINECWRNNRVPDEWSEITISPIYKKGIRSDPSNYRPISLVNTCVKLLTSLMTNRLNVWCEKNKKVSEFQAAYKKGIGCEELCFYSECCDTKSSQKQEKRTLCPIH
jgi:hypothetical protein